MPHHENGASLRTYGERSLCTYGERKKGPCKSAQRLYLTDFRKVRIESSARGQNQLKKSASLHLRLYLTDISVKILGRSQTVQEICKSAPRLYLNRKKHYPQDHLQVCAQA